jgi:hypothetical protein
MLKKIVIVGALLALTGCATHQQSNELAGAAIGGVIGNAVGGRAGAVVGAGVGAMVGGNQPIQSSPPVVVERQIVIPRSATPPYTPQRNCRVFIERERGCYTMRYHDTRAMCIESARNRYYDCMNSR